MFVSVKEHKRENILNTTFFSGERVLPNTEQHIRKKTKQTIANFKFINQAGIVVDRQIYFIVLVVSFFKGTCQLNCETAKYIVDS